MLIDKSMLLAGVPELFKDGTSPDRVCAEAWEAKLRFRLVSLTRLSQKQHFSLAALY